MGTYQKDRQWSDQFLPEIRKIVGPYLLTESSFEIDTKEAADLIIMKARDMTIACRVRREGYADKYPYDFTIRSKRDSGARTEMAKLLEGWGDWMFYGHAGKSYGSLTRWWLIDLHQWRERLLRAGFNNAWKDFAHQKSNNDGTYFLTFDLRAFKPSILIAGSHQLFESVNNF